VLSTKTDQSETGFNLSGKLNYGFNKHYVGVSTALSSISYSLKNDNTNRVQWWLNPSYYLKGKSWYAEAGLGFTLYGDSAETKSKIFPNIAFNYFLVDSNYQITAFFKGDSKMRSYSSISRMNPFVGYALGLHSYNYIDAGIQLKARVNAMIQANLDWAYRKSDNELFFLRAMDQIQQKAVYVSDISSQRISTKVNVTTDFGTFDIFGQWIVFSMPNGLKPFGVPTQKIGLQWQYEPIEKVKTTLSYTYINGIWTSTTAGFNQNKALNDISMSINYSYTPKVKAFLDANNLLSSKYYSFDQYINYGFQLLAGVVISF
jgi:hypothetical protein